MIRLQLTLVLYLIMSLCIYGSFDWTTGNTAVALSASAYCDIASYLTKVYIGYASGFQAIGAFEESTYDTQGYMGVMESQKAIYVVFRGSESIQDWLNNLDAVLTSYPYCSKCEVHKGFYKTEQAVYDLVWTELSTLVQQYPSYKLVVTGHSLGAALATLLTVDLINKKGITNIQLINYGSPRVGNDEFAQYVSNLISNRSRVTHHKDIVPHCPMHERFTHISGEWYQDDSGLKECSGYEDPTCSYQWTVTSISDHMMYLGQYMGCNATIV